VSKVNVGVSKVNVSDDGDANARVERLIQMKRAAGIRKKKERRELVSHISGDTFKLKDVKYLTAMKRGHACCRLS
jgi:hypothetical protein